MFGGTARVVCRCDYMYSVTADVFRTKRQEKCAQSVGRAKWVLLRALSNSMHAFRFRSIGDTWPWCYILCVCVCVCSVFAIAWAHLPRRALCSTFIIHSDRLCLSCVGVCLCNSMIAREYMPLMHSGLTMSHFVSYWHNLVVGRTHVGGAARARAKGCNCDRWCDARGGSRN